MILGIFFARFLPQEGIKVVHQSPPGCIVPEPDVDKPQLFNFETMSEYIIPRQPFCNRYVTVVDPAHKYRILGHPVCIKDPKYVRNEFMFNFCIVVGVDEDMLPYESVVRRLASTFTEMEIQNQFLSQDQVSKTTDRRSIAALLEIIKEDLNNYNECMNPVDDANTINLKLFPYHKPPPPVKAWHVPVAKLKLDEIVDDAWDITMKKVIEHTDGIKDVRLIAKYADVDLELTKTAIQHLIYHDAILMLDFFHFGNIYACTPEITDLIVDAEKKLQDECAAYVLIQGQCLDNYYLCCLFTTLTTFRTVKDWYTFHAEEGLDLIKFIDIRRFLQFGVIKGFIYRVHTFAVSSQYLASIITGQTKAITGGDVLQKYADGCYNFDQITAETNMAEERIMDALKKFPKGDVELIHR